MFLRVPAIWLKAYAEELTGVVRGFCDVRRVVVFGFASAVKGPWRSRLRIRVRRPRRDQVAAASHSDVVA